MLVDKFGRVITTLRLIVTYRCNLSCFFCHHEGAFPERELLDAKDYGFVAKVGVSLGITKYRITGGEPLIRKDIVDIVSEIAQVDGVEDLSITTNGTLITRRLLEELKEAGLDRINISLHTLDRAHYKEITGKDMLDKVLSGIDNAVEVGFKEIKINVVLLHGINDGEIASLVKYAASKKVVLQLIELEPVDLNIFRKYHEKLPSESTIASLSNLPVIRVSIRNTQHRKIVELGNGVKIEYVNPLENREFCKYCNRLRLTPGGKIKPCLFSKDYVDALLSIKERDEKSLKEAFIKVLKYRKPYFSMV